MTTGVITEIDEHGMARVQTDDGAGFLRDLCALTKLAQPAPDAAQKG